MDRVIGKRTGRNLEATHKIVGVFDRNRYVDQMTARITEHARVTWHNDKLLVKAEPGDTVEILTQHGDPTPIRVTALQINVAHQLFCRYPSLDRYIAEEVQEAYRDSGYVHGKQYVLKEVRGEHISASTVVVYQRSGFRDLRAVPIGENP